MEKGGGGGAVPNMPSKQNATVSYAPSSRMTKVPDLLQRPLPKVRPWVESLGSSVADVGAGLDEDEKRSLVHEQRLWADHMLRRSERAAAYKLEARAEAKDRAAAS